MGNKNTEKNVWAKNENCVARKKKQSIKDINIIDIKIRSLEWVKYVKKCAQIKLSNLI